MKIDQKKISTTIFLSGLLFALFIRVGWIAVPYMDRNLPPEFDDAYNYIFRGTLLNNCLLQTCPAVSDLLRQSELPSHDFSLEPDPVKGFYKQQFYSMPRYIGPPVHPLLLSLIHRLGAGWESAYMLLGLATIGAIVVTAALLLRHLFGPAPAGIALMLLALHPFSGQGLHFMVPSTLTLWFTLFIWWLLLRHPGQLYAILPLGILIMVATHPMGQIYGVITIALAMGRILGEDGRPHRRKALLGSILGLVLVVAPFVLPNLVSDPMRFFPPVFNFPATDDWRGWAGIMKNMHQATAILNQSIAILGGSPPFGILPFGLLLLVGIKTLDPRRARIVWTFLLSLSGALAISLLYVFPGIPADLFQRIFVPFFILFLGLFGQAAYWAMLGTGHWLVGELREGRWPQPTWRELFLVLVGLTFLYGFFHHQRQGYWDLRDSLQRLVNRQNHALDPGQPERVRRVLHRNEKVLFNSTDLARFFLFYGGLEHGAVFHDTLRGTEDEASWISEDRNLKVLVEYNPLLWKFGSLNRTSNYRQGGLLIQGTTNVTLTIAAPGTFAKLKLLLANPDPLTDPGSQASLVIIPDGAQPPPLATLSVPPGIEGWFPLQPRATTLAIRVLRLSVSPPDARILLKGIRVDDEKSLNWPWDRGVTLAYAPADRRQKAGEFPFSGNSMPTVSNRAFKRVLDDSGSGIVVEIY